MPVIAIDERLLDEKLTQLETARNWSPRVISKLETAIRTADDYDLFRVNPLQFAAQRGLAENEAIDLFLHAARHGLFEMQWHLVCPSCGHIVTSFRELARLHSHLFCDFCGMETEVTLDDYIQVTFTIAPGVRDIAFHHPDTLSIEDFYFKYHWSRGMLPLPDGQQLQDLFARLTQHLAFVMPEERIQIELELDPGGLHAKDLSQGATLAFSLGDASDPAAGAPAVSFELDGGEFRTGAGSVPLQPFDFPLGRFHVRMAGELNSGKLNLEFTNRMAVKSPLWVFHFPAWLELSYLKFEPFLSGKRLLSTQTFRDLFRFEVVESQEGIAVHDITFLFTDLKGSTALYERVGDLQAYYLVRQHFDTLGRVVAQHSGAIVKTIGDAVMASFTNPLDAVKAALGMLQEIQAFNRGISDELILKIGIHRGPSIAVTLNDRLDYFGQTVNVAARVQDLAGAGEIFISADAHDYPGIDELLAGYDVAAQEANVRGLSGRMGVYRVTARTGA